MNTKLAPNDDGLLVGLLGESAAADAHREAEVVADQRARPGLPADAAFVHHEDAQPLRGAVDGRGQARRPGAHDDDVEVALLELDRGTCGLRDLGVGGVAQRPPVGKDHQRELRLGARPREQLAPLAPTSARQKACGTAHCSKTSLSS